jgi:hypothetical protein
VLPKEGSTRGSYGHTSGNALDRGPYQKVKTKDQLKIVDKEIFQRITRLKIERSLLEKTMKYLFQNWKIFHTSKEPFLKKPWHFSKVKFCFRMCHCNNTLVKNFASL